jgi:hypothetical protein
MKKLLIGVFALCFALAAGPAFAQNYSTSIGTAATISPGGTITMDISVIDLPEALVSDGVWLTYDTSLVEITAVGVYDSGTGGTIAGASGSQITSYSSLGGCWDGAISSLAWQGSGAILITTAIVGACPTSGTTDLFTRVTFQCLGAGTATITLNDVTAACVGVTGALDIANDPLDITITQEVECTEDSDCPFTIDGLFCTVDQVCIANACVPPTSGGPINPCNDGDACTLNTCVEGSTGPECSYPCDVPGLSGPTDVCCETLPCSENPVCSAQVTLIKEDSYFSPTAPAPITVKNKICMDNPSDLVGGIQFDLCDSPDCMTCIDCELTERTTMFDCVVLELDSGCCRVIMFCKNPGCAMNPGLCNIVTVVQQMKDPLPEGCGEACIIETFENIVVSDYDGYALAGAGLPGSICPVVCGDVCPPCVDEDPADGECDNPGANDCGDGVVDIYDIMCEVDFALTATTPNACQAPRADVPTGTPPNCIEPDEEINILDIMVLIDMALNRQDCCSFYYEGIIY